MKLRVFVEASELPARRRPTPDQNRMLDGGPQSADDGAVEAGEIPALADDQFFPLFRLFRFLTF